MCVLQDSVTTPALSTGRDKVMFGTGMLTLKNARPPSPAACIVCSVASLLVIFTAPFGPHERHVRDESALVVRERRFGWMLSLDARNGDDDVAQMT